MKKIYYRISRTWSYLLFSVCVLSTLGLHALLIREADVIDVKHIVHKKAAFFIKYKICKWQTLIQKPLIFFPKIKHLDVYFVRKCPIIRTDLQIRAMFGFVLTHPPTPKSEHSRQKIRTLWTLYFNIGPHPIEGPSEWLYISLQYMRK